MTDDRTEAVEEPAPCPFCGGPAMKPRRYNGAWETGCAGDHDCPGTDVMAPIALWNRRAQAALSALQEGWRPIESAPKDGTRFLAVGPDFDGVRVVSWVKTSHVPAEDADLCSPTHWMPLPPPPAQEEADG